MRLHGTPLAAESARAARGDPPSRGQTPDAFSLVQLDQDTLAETAEETTP